MSIDKIGIIALADDVLALLAAANINVLAIINANTITPAVVNTDILNTDTLRVTQPYMFSNIIQYTSNSFYVKPANLAYIHVIAVGGGGGGGSGTCNSASIRGGGGGGAGAHCESILYASQLANSETITIGARGIGGANAVNGSNGTNTVFGNNSLVVAGGGEGGNCNMRGVLPSGFPRGGQGGDAFRGQIARDGFSGGAGYNGGFSGGKGGNSTYGEGRESDIFANGAGGGTGFGVGGSAGTATTNPSIQLGCNGTAGVLFVREYMYTKLTVT